RSRAAAITVPSSAEISRFDMQGVCGPSAMLEHAYIASYPNNAQSFGNESSSPGLMSFQKVKLPSAPNLYSSLPSVGWVPWNHSALLAADRGVESGSPAAVLTGTGFRVEKSPIMSVHFVTLPSFPNLNSCWPWAPVCPVNHSAPLKTVRFCGSKPNPPPGLAVHFVTLPSAPNLYS